MALAVGPVLKSVRHLDEARRHARDLAPAVVEMLAAQGWRPRDLSGVIVSRGPGSYTGLRVGLMSARTLAYAIGSALVAVDTFAASALQAPAEVLRLDVVGDAQQGKVYAQQFVCSRGEARPAPAGPLVILPFDEWLSRRTPHTWVSGPGLHVYQTRLPTGTLVVDSTLWDPRPESLLEIGLARFQAGERDDIWKLEPLYLRPSSAEEQWKNRPAG